MLNKRQDLILSFIKDNPNTNVKNIELFLNQMSISPSRMTITRDLKILIDNNLIIKNGYSKNTTYSPSINIKILDNIDVNLYFSKEQDIRFPNKILFNFDIFHALNNLLNNREKTDLYNINQNYIKKKSILSSILLKKEFERITIELAWKSSKIEGNTYSLLDTERLIKENIVATGKTKQETIMILNHKKTLDFILNNPSYYENINIFKIEEIHRLLTDNLLNNYGLRKTSVAIVGTNYKPLDNIYQIQDAMQNLINIINITKNPLEKALIAILMIAYIQPFEDGNKRTSRILGNAILLANNYCPLSYRSIDEIEYKKAIILFYEINNASYFKKLFIDQFINAVEFF